MSQSRFWQWLIVTSIAVLAFLRLLFHALTGMAILGVVAISVAGIIEKVDALTIPVLGPYLERVSVDAYVTLLGIVIATFAAARAWRSQKKDELLFASLHEVQSFVDHVLSAASRLNAYMRLVTSLKADVESGPYRLDDLFRASYLNGKSEEMEALLTILQQAGVEVYGIDSRNLHTTTSSPVLYHRFKVAKRVISDLSDKSYFSFPIRAASPDAYIDLLRLTPPAPIFDYLRSFEELHAVGGGAVGGLRGAIQSKFFPPTFTFAWAVLKSTDD